MNKRPVGQRPHVTASAVCLILGTCLAACGHPSSEEEGRAGQEPAAVRASIQEATDPEWTIDPEPEMRVGEGEDAVLIFHRISETLILEDGSLLVVDSGDLRLYHLNEDGTLRAVIGSPGVGPGEFRRITGVVAKGTDSLVVFDAAALRLTWFDLDGLVLQTVPIAPPVQTTNSLDTYHLADLGPGGSMILIPRGRVVRATSGSGTLRETLPVLRYASGGAFLEELSTRQELEIWVGEGPNMVVPYGDHRTVAAGHGQVFELEHQTGQIRVWSQESGLRMIRIETQRRALGPPERKAWIESRTARIEEEEARRQATAFLARAPFPDSVPHASGVRVGTDGSIWLNMVPDAPTRDQAIHVQLDDYGSETDRVVLPGNLHVQAIDDSSVVGIWSDDLGQQSIRRYRRIGPR